MGKLGGVPELSHDLPVPGRALAVAAHPDDVEFRCGATLARWATAGCEITHVICTDGSKGTWDPSADLEDLVARRREEQIAASFALGGSGVVEFLGRIDGELSSDTDTRRLVARAIRRHRPDVVLGHDPWKRYRLHPDHRHAGWLVVDGVVAARDPHFHPELDEEPHRPSVLLLFEADEPDHLETATEWSLARRCAALECHESQFETTHLHRLGDGRDPATLDAFRARERAKLAEMGAIGGVELAEAFKKIDDL